MPDNERFIQVFKYLKENRYVRNQQDFTERIKSDKSTISQILNNRINIPKILFINLCEVFPFISKSWLLSGDGDMLAEGNADIENANYRLIPLIHTDSVGGMHSPNQIVDESEYIEKYIPFIDAYEDDKAILQSGDSMIPTIPPGSIMQIRKVENWREYFGYGNIFVLLLKDGRRITKEVKRYDDNPKEYVWCVSHNPAVDDEELPKSMIVGVWKVIKILTDRGW